MSSETSGRGTGRWSCLNRGRRRGESWHHLAAGDAKPGLWPIGCTTVVTVDRRRLHGRTPFSLTLPTRPALSSPDSPRRCQVSGYNSPSVKRIPQNLMKNYPEIIQYLDKFTGRKM